MPPKAPFESSAITRQALGARGVGRQLAVEAATLLGRQGAIEKASLVRRQRGIVRVMSTGHELDLPGAGVGAAPPSSSSSRSR